MDSNHRIDPEGVQPPSSVTPQQQLVLLRPIGTDIMPLPSVAPQQQQVLLYPISSSDLMLSSSTSIISILTMSRDKPELALEAWAKMIQSSMRAKVVSLIVRMCAVYLSSELSWQLRFKQGGDMGGRRESNSVLCKRLGMPERLFKQDLTKGRKWKEALIPITKLVLDKQPTSYSVVEYLHKCITTNGQSLTSAIQSFRDSAFRFDRDGIDSWIKSISTNIEQSTNSTTFIATPTIITSLSHSISQQDTGIGNINTSIQLESENEISNHNTTIATTTTITSLSHSISQEKETDTTNSRTSSGDISNDTENSSSISGSVGISSPTKQRATCKTIIVNNIFTQPILPLIITVTKMYFDNYICFLNPLCHCSLCSRLRRGYGQC
jgi:hypothetical protein